MLPKGEIGFNQSTTIKGAQILKCHLKGPNVILKVQQSVSYKTISSKQIDGFIALDQKPLRYL